MLVKSEYDVCLKFGKNISVIKVTIFIDTMTLNH